MRLLITLIILISASFGLHSQEKEATLKKYDLVSGYEIKEMTIDEVVFSYTMNTIQDTVKIWTTDPKFTTPEGYKVSTKLKEFPKKLQNQVVKRHDGYRLELNSCWYLFFCEGEKCTDQPLTPGSEVKWIQKNR
ncbi:MAG TPA: hypothetical protein VGB43_01200 [Flavobacterium sp.]|jgi:hypothetical protein